MCLAILTILLLPLGTQATELVVMVDSPDGLEPAGQLTTTVTVAAYESIADLVSTQSPRADVPPEPPDDGGSCTVADAAPTASLPTLFAIAVVLMRTRRDQSSRASNAKS